MKSGLTNKPLQYILFIVPGALMPLAYAPYNLFFLSILCPAVLFLKWQTCSPSRAFVYGYMFGLGMFGVGLYWLHISINLFGGVNIPGAILITALLVSYMALYPALTGYFLRRYFERHHLYGLVLIFPSLWVLSEWIRSWFLTGLPWLNIGYSHTDAFLSAWAPLTGVYGVSWLSLFLSALLTLLYRSRGKQAVTCLLVIGVLSACSWYLSQLSWTRAFKDDVDVALIQGGIPQELKWRPEQRRPSLELYLGLSEPYWGDDLIIWPETAIPAYSYQVGNFIDKLEALSRHRGSILLSGIPSKEPEQEKYFNSILMLSSEERKEYHKQHLVPFGEYLPLKPLLGVFFHFLKIPMSDFSQGAQVSRNLHANDMTLGVSICYEDTFGEEVIESLPEADVLINISNDAWFGDSSAPHQHLQMAQMRAIETGRYMLRATNTGVSAIIDEKGRIIERSPQFEATALAGTIKLFEGNTPYASTGNWPVVILSLVLVLLIHRLQKNTIPEPDGQED